MVGDSFARHVWAFKLKPHQQGTFTLSTDDFFVEKMRDVVGLSMSPPDHAVVLCVDEKSQVQVLERGQPVLPMLFGPPERRTPQYLRHEATAARSGCLARQLPRELDDGPRGVRRPPLLEVPFGRRIAIWMSSSSAYSPTQVVFA